MSIVHLKIEVDTSKKVLLSTIKLGTCFVFVFDYENGYDPVVNPLEFYRITMARKVSKYRYYRIAYGYINFNIVFYRDMLCYKVFLRWDEHAKIFKELEAYRGLPQPRPYDAVLGSPHKKPLS